MTAKTRRRVFLSFLVLALTVPAETILLKALQSSDDTEAARQWVDSLDSPRLTSAADAIQAYSFVYRQQIMRALSPEARAAVWRTHIEGYIAAHKELDGAAVDALRGAQRALTGRALSDDAAAADRDALQASARQIETLLGLDEARYIAHDLGPRTSTFASADPLMLKLASFVRGQVALLARNTACDCADDAGCGYYETYCSSSQGCQSDNSWPMCGYWWNTPCNGLCTAF